MQRARRDLLTLVVPVYSLAPDRRSTPIQGDQARTAADHAADRGVRPDETRAMLGVVAPNSAIVPLHVAACRNVNAPSVALAVPCPASIKRLGDDGRTGTSTPSTAPSETTVLAVLAPRRGVHAMRVRPPRSPSRRRRCSRRAAAPVRPVLAQHGRKRPPELSITLSMRSTPLASRDAQGDGPVANSPPSSVRSQKRPSFSPRCSIAGADQDAIAVHRVAAANVIVSNFVPSGKLLVVAVSGRRRERSDCRRTRARRRRPSSPPSSSRCSPRCRRPTCASPPPRSSRPPSR